MYYKNLKKIYCYSRVNMYCRYFILDMTRHL